MKKPSSAAFAVPRSAAAAVIAAALFLPPIAAAENPDISGIAQTRATGALSPDYGHGVSASYGFEQYANLRLKAEVGERGTVYAATNLIAAAGEGALDVDPFVVGQNYAAALELERLYYRIEGDAFDFQAGLMRTAFGFGQAFRPSDFLSPPNPLLPDARPRGVLGATLMLYPADEWKATAFAVAGRDPTEADGDGVIAGVSTDYHWSKASVQLLYAAESAEAAVHRFGLSVKVEAGAGIVFDALYTLDGGIVDSGDYYDRTWNGSQGLVATLGADYSVLNGKLYLLGQYLFNGAGILGPDDDLDRLYYEDTGVWSNFEPALRTLRSDVPHAELHRKNYLYTAFSYRWSDYTVTTLSCVSGLDDLSFSPLAAVEHDLFQGLTVGFSLRVPLDRATFSDSAEYGELGPTHTGMSFQATASAKARF
jgi:hypothetical protein